MLHDRGGDKMSYKRICGSVWSPHEGGMCPLNRCPNLDGQTHQPPANIVTVSQLPKVPTEDKRNTYQIFQLITTDKGVEQMSLDVLQDYLFASFKMGGVGANIMQKNKRLTIALRALTNRQSLFKTCHASKMDFWKSFQKAFLAIDSAKWTFYEEKEIKKIEKANKSNEDYIVLICQHHRSPHSFKMILHKNQCIY
ncbi:Hypothetical predicted protein [Mytilus galloprovincialis]|uniref:Uncharacterized protein n=1 Tax=Mytilus galloprovincialis TaxID=29158 RepID=A0A8B6E4R9_MYTGA|nr:Hypothetical predicted protein [Mytilus galloprovincialis]